MILNNKLNTNKWYSVIISLLMIWFLLVLTVWIFDLVLKEMYDNRGMWNYLKAFAWAESAQELALLKIKEKWYWIYDKIDESINERSVILSDNPQNKDNFNRSREVFISYDLDTETVLNDWSSWYDWLLKPLWYDIIPLFYEDKNDIYHILSIREFIVDSSFLWDSNDLIWNIVSENSWISWVSSVSWLWAKKIINTNNELEYDTQDINDYLSSTSSEKSYLILFNSDSTDGHDLLYKITSDHFFSKPKTQIISSWQIWKYKQNLVTDLDNTEYLNILKYSIYSK